MKTAIATAVLCAMCVSFAGARPDFEPSLVSIVVQPGKQAGEIGVTITNNSGKPISLWEGGWAEGATLYGIDASNQQKIIYPTGPFGGSGMIVSINPGKSETIPLRVPAQVLKVDYKAYVVSMTFGDWTWGSSNAGAAMTVYSAAFTWK